MAQLKNSVNGGFSGKAEMAGIDLVGFLLF